jgi:hypothetical protein
VTTIVVHNAADLQQACVTVGAGDVIVVHPGRYITRSLMSGKQGSLAAPITIRFAGGGWIACETRADFRWREPYVGDDRAPWDDAPPRARSGDFAFLQIIGCSHVHVEGLAVRGAWPTIFYIENSTHVAIRDCVLEGGIYAVFAGGSVTSHLLLDGNSWRQDTSLGHDLWSRIDWREAHGGEGAGGRYRYFNGGFLSARRIVGHVVVSNNRISDAYNGVRMKGDLANPDRNAHVHIFDNLFLRIRDNPIELEGHATDWHVRHNRLLDCHSWFSVDGATGGHWYFYGNLASFVSRQGLAPSAGGDPAASHTMGRVLKLSYQTTKVGAPDPESSSHGTPTLPWFVAHNSFDLRCPIIGGASPADPPDGEGPDFTANLTFAANAFSFADAPSTDRWTVVAIDPRDGSPIPPIRNFDFGRSKSVTFDGNLWHCGTSWPDYRMSATNAPSCFEARGVATTMPLFAPDTAQAVLGAEAIRAFRLAPGVVAEAEKLVITAANGDTAGVAVGTDGRVLRGAVQSYGLARIPKLEEGATTIIAEILGGRPS